MRSIVGLLPDIRSVILGIDSIKLNLMESMKIDSKINEIICNAQHVTNISNVNLQELNIDIDKTSYVTDAHIALQSYIDIFSLIDGINNITSVL